MLINDALATINAFQPVLTRAMQEGREVTDEELKLASARSGIAIQRLDDLIAQDKKKALDAMAAENQKLGLDY
jgi:uncharacterized protein YbjQ (UPF0145 family)